MVDCKAHSSQASALILDAGPSGEVLREHLLLSGFAVCQVADAVTALAVARVQLPSFAFVEIGIDGKRAIELIRQLCATSPQTRIVVLTAYASVDSALAAIRNGADSYLAKPFAPAQIERLTGRSRSAPERAGPANWLPLAEAAQQYIVDVLGRSGSMSATARALGSHRRSLRRMLARVQRVRADSEATQETAHEFEPAN
ncbi:MAG TPA: response regulator, partial [Polyangiaceae bacterium]